MELRKDYILDRWVIISETRGHRPKQFEKVTKTSEVACYFCPGNEETTPKEIGRVPQGKEWLIRWFPNKFPFVVAPEGRFSVKAGFLTHAQAFGYHEVIVETPEHGKQLADLPVKHISMLLKVCSQRITELSKRKNTKYVTVFKNHGQSAGTSIVHTHTQVATLPMLPQAVAEEVKASTKSKKCLYCEIIQKEKKSLRFIDENDSFISIAPYASRFNYEAWIFPKKHIGSITEFSDKQYADCAAALRNILVKLKQLNADYNFLLHYSPKGAGLHFHIEVLPRIALWGGFELCSNIVINSVAPETAANFYRTP